LMSRPRQLTGPQAVDRWQRLVETLPHIVLAASPDGSFEYVSPQCGSFAGLPQSAFLGNGWFDLIHPEDRSMSVRAWAEPIRTGNEYGAEHRLRRADGEYRWFACHAQPVRDVAGCIANWTGICFEVTERRQAESERPKHNQHEDSTGLQHAEGRAQQTLQ